MDKESEGNCTCLLERWVWGCVDSCGANKFGRTLSVIKWVKGNRRSEDLGLHKGCALDFVSNSKAHVGLVEQVARPRNCSVIHWPPLLHAALLLQFTFNQLRCFIFIWFHYSSKRTLLVRFRCLLLKNCFVIIFYLSRVERLISHAGVHSFLQMR